MATVETTRVPGQATMRVTSNNAVAAAGATYTVTLSTPSSNNFVLRYF